MSHICDITCIPVNDVMSKCGLLSNEINAAQGLAMYNLRSSADPMTFNTKVLKQPQIKFGQNNVKQANNGSFDLRGVTFARYDHNISQYVRCSLCLSH